VTPRSRDAENWSKVLADSDQPIPQVISDPGRDVSGDYDRVREIEQQHGHIPGVRIAIYALNECATVMSTEEMLERVGSF
jgi:hypothetical protein